MSKKINKAKNGLCIRTTNCKQFYSVYKNKKKLGTYKSTDLSGWNCYRKTI